MSGESFQVLRRWTAVYEHHSMIMRLPKMRGPQNLYQFLRDGSSAYFNKHNPPFALVTQVVGGNITAVCQVFDWDFDTCPALFMVRVLVTVHRKGHKDRLLEDMTRIEKDLTADGLADMLAQTASSIESLSSVGFEFLDSLREL